MSVEPSHEFLKELPETEWSVLEEMGRHDSAVPSWEKDYSLPVVDYLRVSGRTEEEALLGAQEFFGSYFMGPDDCLEEVGGAFRVTMRQSLKRYLTGVSECGSVSEAEHAFDRAWSLTLMQKAIECLREELEGAGQLDLFLLLAPVLDRRPLSLPRAELAAQLELPVSELTTILFKMPQRYRHYLEQEIRQSVTTRDELESEVIHLQSVWN